jgi:hypothetical protein
MYVVNVRNVHGGSPVTRSALSKPKTVAKVRRTELRDNQRKFLKAASGSKVVEVLGGDEHEEKYVVDKQYFDELVATLRATMETLEITKNPKLFQQILRASGTIEEDIRLGKLHSLEEAFGDE